MGHKASRCSPEGKLSNQHPDKNPKKAKRNHKGKKRNEIIPPWAKEEAAGVVWLST